MCVVSWNVQRVSSGLSTLIQYVLEREEWDAILVQELSFEDELSDVDELEASLGDHRLVTIPNTAIVIHSRWKDSLRWCASSRHAVWVGVKAAEEFTFCTAHLPSWADDCQSGAGI